MTPLDLHASPLAAAIRARTPEPAQIAWIFHAARRTWCALRAAEPGAHVTTLCCERWPYAPVNVLTRRPHNVCPACATELAAMTPGAAVAVEPITSRTTTPDLRRPAVELDVEALLGGEWDES